MTLNMSLFKYLLKKNIPWLLLGVVVIVITVIILPLILGGEIEEGNIALGYFLVQALAFVSMQVALNFLHKPRQLADIKAKPVSLFEQVSQRVIINIMNGLAWMLMLVVISFALGFELQEFFAPMIPLMMIIIMLTAISNLIAGSLAFGVLLTIFNFMLPLMTVGVIHSVLLLVGAKNPQLDVSDTIRYVTDHLIPLDRWYFIYYANHDQYGILILQLLGMTLALVVITHWLSKIRVHEKIGDTLVFKKYMYFMTYLIASMAGYIFIFAVEQDEFYASSIAFVILYALVYYVLMAVHHRTFKLEPVIYRRLIIFYLIFFAVVLVSMQLVELIL